MQGHDGRETALDRPADHVPVVREGGARDTSLHRLDTRPLDTEPVGVEAEFTQEIHVLGPAVKTVGGVPARLAHEGVGPVLEGPPVAPRVVALDLVGGGGRTHQEAIREDEFGLR